MICPNCKKEIEKTSICPHCGFEFNKENIYKIMEKQKIPPINLNIFSFRGRIGRLQYFCTQILLLIFIYEMLTVSHIIGDIIKKPHLEDLTLFIFALLAPYFLLTLTIKRLRDIKLSLWTILLFLVPLINSLYELYIMLAPSAYPNYEKYIKKI